VRILLTIHHHLDAEAGAPGATVRLAQEYARAGHEVTVLSFDDLPARLGERARVMAFPAFVAHRVRTAPRPYDVIDASSGDAAWLDPSTERLGRTAVVFRSHGLEHVHYRRLRAGSPAPSVLGRLYHGGYRLAEVARSLRRADLALLLNAGDARYAVDRLHVPADRVHVVPNGVPAAFVDGEPGPPVVRPRVVVVGSHLARKGVIYAAFALNILLDRHPELTAAFLGTRCPPEQVYADIDPQLRDRVEVVPYYPNGALPTLVRSGDIHLFPTLAEGFPLALLETMACGLVPVVSDVDGPTEVARDHVNALVVPPRSPLALVDAVEALLADRGLRQRLAGRAAATARRYTWARVAALNLRLIHDAVRRKRGGVPAVPVPTASGGHHA
jgi:glycosyltransferase involved in cell wall biosynthesis